MQGGSYNRIFGVAWEEEGTRASLMKYRCSAREIFVSVALDTSLRERERKEPMCVCVLI